MKVIHSRDVVFDETTVSGIEKEDAPKYVKFKTEGEPAAEVPTSPDGAQEETTVQKCKSVAKLAIRLVTVATVLSRHCGTSYHFWIICTEHGN